MFDLFIFTKESPQNIGIVDQYFLVFVPESYQTWQNQKNLEQTNHWTPSQIMKIIIKF